MNLLKAGKYDGWSVASGSLLLISLRDFQRFGKATDKIQQAML